MKKLLDDLWDGYFSEECSVIDDEKERELIRRLDDLHKKMNDLMTNEQTDAVEKYIEALYDVQNTFIKKAFFKGCKFTLSFMFETTNF